MKRQCLPFACILLLSGFAAGVSAQEQVVVPFDFVSKFDQGRYGRMVGEMVWKKLEREKGFVIPEAMLDVREFCRTNHLEIGPDTPLSKMKKIVRDDFGADIGVWGSIERAPGHALEVYDLVLKCVDFSADPPRVIYDKSARTESAGEISHRYVNEMLNKLYGRDEGAGGPAPLAVEEENWKNQPNLVKGGDFERGSGGIPYGWEKMGGHVREPLGGLVKWIPEAGNPENRVVRFTFDQALGDSFGVLYYSEFFPVEEGAKYRFQCRYRTNGPAVKVFIKCYDEMESEYRADGTDTQKAATASRLKKTDYVPTESQRREVYRSQQNLKGPKNQWNTQTEDFTPKHTKYTPRWGRVMLYAYLGGGVVEFDDVVVKQILPASPGESEKIRRHSLETGVTIKEMEENERRAKEPRERP